MSSLFTRVLPAFAAQESFRYTRSPHRISRLTATKTSVPRRAIVRRGPGLTFLFEEKTDVLMSSTDAWNRACPGAGLLSQLGV